MIILYGSLSILLITVGLYTFLKSSLRLPNTQAIAAIKNLNGKVSFEQSLKKALKPLSKIIARLLPISQYKEENMQNDFNRLGITDSPQEYTALLKAKSIVTCILGCIFIPLGIPLISIFIAVITILMYLKNVNDIKKKIEKINNSIQSELPRFIETLNYSLDGSRDFISFVERYRSVAGNELGKELDRLLIDLKTGDSQVALMKMDRRVGLPTLSKLVAILCNVSSGIDKQQSLLLLEQDVRAKEREYIKDQLNKQPRRIKASSIILTLLMILLFMIPLGVMIFDNLILAGF